MSEPKGAFKMISVHALKCIIFLIILITTSPLIVSHITSLILFTITLQILKIG